jgi:peptidoglycan/xylan/chitin deacetylase (PgdA/CDA1 family)
VAAQRAAGPQPDAAAAGRGRARGEVAITLDDGPDPEVTPAVLDQLDAAWRPRHLLLHRRARTPRSRRCCARSCAAAMRCRTTATAHRHHFSLLRAARLAAEIGRAQAVLADLAGRMPHGFRAPAGLRNPLLDPVLHRLGLHLVSWTRRGFDTREADPQRVLQRLSSGLAGGDILLLHDGHARAQRRWPRGGARRAAGAAAALPRRRPEAA